MLSRTPNSIHNHNDFTENYRKLCYLKQKVAELNVKMTALKRLNSPIATTKE